MTNTMDKPAPAKLPKCNWEHYCLVLRMFLAEFLGLVVLCFALVIYANNSIPMPLVTGFIFTWATWVFGPISGAQLNPVISVMLTFTRRISIVHALFCIVAQFSGAIFGSWLGKLLGPTSIYNDRTVGMSLKSSEISIGQAIAIEIIATTVPVSLLLSTLDEFRSEPWAQGPFTIFPLAIGTAISFCASVFGPYTGASMNPARSLGPAIINGNFEDQWIYVVGPTIGALLATLVCEMLLSDAATLRRLKAWFTESDFDQSRDYQTAGRRHSVFSL